MSNEFKWTDKLVEQYAEQYRFSSGRITIEMFKEDKRPKPIMTTVDGVNYYEGEKKFICGVHTQEGFNSNGAWEIGMFNEFSEGLKAHYQYFFSSRNEAENWILYNKPLISLHEIKEIGKAQEDNIHFKKLVVLAKCKLNK